MPKENRFFITILFRTEKKSKSKRNIWFKILVCVAFLCVSWNVGNSFPTMFFLAPFIDEEPVILYDITECVNCMISQNFTKNMLKNTWKNSYCMVCITKNCEKNCNSTVCLTNLLLIWYDDWRQKFSGEAVPKIFLNEIRDNIHTGEKLHNTQAESSNWMAKIINYRYNYDVTGDFFLHWSSCTKKMLRQNCNI